MLRHLAVAVSVGLVATLAACGRASSYESAEGGLRAWLSAVHEGDPSACDGMTPEYRRALTEQLGPEDPAIACEHAIASADPVAVSRLPSADSAMEVPAWDPSGEALVEVTEAESVVRFWMRLEDENWLVAGPEDQRDRSPANQRGRKTALRGGGDQRGAQVLSRDR